MIRNLAKFVIILSLTCLVIGSGVAGLYGLFRADIARRESATKQNAIQEVCPEGTAVDVQAPLAGEALAEDAVYAARDANGKIVAYVAQGEAQGYSSLIKVMVGAVPKNGDLAVYRVVVLSQQETPGLGANVAEQKSNYTLWEKLFGPSEPGKMEKLINTFLNQFRGKRPPEFNEIHGITAATITSNATKQAVEKALQRIRQVRENLHE